MRIRRLYIPIVVLTVALWGDVYAQESAFDGNVFGNTNAAVYDMYSSAYGRGTVVSEPFSDYLPSDDAAEAAGMSTPRSITNRRNSFIVPGEPNRDPESPVGEPWVMLAFAGVAGVVIAVRQKRTKTL